MSGRNWISIGRLEGLPSAELAVSVFGKGLSALPMGAVALGVLASAGFALGAPSSVSFLGLACFASLTSAALLAKPRLRPVQAALLVKSREVSLRRGATRAPFA